MDDLRIHPITAYAVVTSLLGRLHRPLSSHALDPCAHPGRRRVAACSPDSPQDISIPFVGQDSAFILAPDFISHNLTFVSSTPGCHNLATLLFLYFMASTWCDRITDIGVSHLFDYNALISSFFPVFILFLLLVCLLEKKKRKTPP